MSIYLFKIYPDIKNVRGKLNDRPHLLENLANNPDNIKYQHKINSYTLHLLTVD